MQWLPIVCVRSHVRACALQMRMRVPANSAQCKNEHVLLYIDECVPSNVDRAIASNERCDNPDTNLCVCVWVYRIAYTPMRMCCRNPHLMTSSNVRAKSADNQSNSASYATTRVIDYRVNTHSNTHRPPHTHTCTHTRARLFRLNIVLNGAAAAHKSWPATRHWPPADRSTVRPSVWPVTS